MTSNQSENAQSESVGAVNTSVLDMAGPLTGQDSAPSREFKYFTLLPAEIQIQIWKLCIPRRMIEVDCPDINHHRDQPVAPMLQNWPLSASPPVITRVCQASRGLVLAEGGQLVFRQCTNIDRDAVVTPYDVPGSCPGSHKPFWINPKYDTMVILASHVPFAENGDFVIRLPLYCQIAPPCDRAALVAYLIADPRYRYGETMVLPPSTLTLTNHDMCMAIVPIHLPSRIALALGMFGLTGEESTATVSLYDDETLAKLLDFCPDRTFPASYKIMRRFESRSWIVHDYAYWLARRGILPEGLERFGNPVFQDWHDGAQYEQHKYLYDIVEGKAWVRAVDEIFPQLRSMLVFRQCEAGCRKDADAPEHRVRVFGWDLEAQRSGKDNTGSS